MGLAALALRRMRVFLYGTLCHPPLLRAVLGRAADVRPALLADHAVFRGAGVDVPLLVPAPGETAPGQLLSGLNDEDMARLGFYEAAFGYAARNVTVSDDAGGPVPAVVYLPDTAPWGPGGAWSLADWAARWGETATRTAGDVMALIAERDPAEVGQRYFHMLVRGASRVRAAAEPAPADRRRGAAAGDVALARRRQPYARFFSVEEYDLAFRRFDGAMSETVNRAVFITGDAATVLPYDPHRDRVLLIEQFRSGPYARGDRNPWLLEPVAGRIDPGETPEAAARREAREEAGLEIGALHLVGRYYPSPGVKSEFLYSYVGIAELPDTAARIAGVDDEAEDIRGHVLDFAAFMDIAASPEAAAAPVLISALWLERNRAALRAGAPPSSVSRG